MRAQVGACRTQQKRQVSEEEEEEDRDGCVERTRHEPREEVRAKDHRIDPRLRRNNRRRRVVNSIFSNFRDSSGPLQYKKPISIRLTAMLSNVSAERKKQLQLRPRRWSCRDRCRAEFHSGTS